MTIFQRCVLITFLWNIPIVLVYAGCNTTYAGIPTYKNCEYRCHCKEDTQCEENTGDCDNGCAYGWMGPSCQYRNVVKGYTRIQNMGGTSKTSEYATSAVDGNTITCSKTSTNNGFVGIPQYWRIELKRRYFVVGIVLHIPEADTGNFANFRVMYGDTWDGMSSVCYQHPNIQGSSVMNIMCQQPVLTQYMRVILNVTDTSLRICEFEIYGGRDVAFNRQTTGPPNYNDWYPYRAVDGRFLQTGETAGVNPKTCFASRSMITPWWQLDLGLAYDIHDIYYYGRESTTLAQMRGFVVSVGRSNTSLTDIYTDPQDSGDVYQPHETALQSTYSGQHVQMRIPDITNIITICELQVFADCPFETCGWDCSVPCHCNTQYLTGLYKISGVCPDGCSGRWTGVGGMCDTRCTITEWGSNCQYTCGDCLDAPCSVVDGLCQNNCTGASKPPSCIDSCDDFWYGQNCVYRCGNCKHNQPCDKGNGYCSNGCATGVKGDHCSTPCDGLKFGEDCAYNCGNCFEVPQCDLQSGVCDQGCDRGYSGELCQQECGKGFYGYNCNDTCGECVEADACDRRTGVCDDGCAGGYHGELCKYTCDSGYYGPDCAYACGYCLDNNICDRVNGTCPNGCEIGYQPPTCTEACQKGLYGHACTGKCGKCRDIDQCDFRTGSCSSGCNLGYTNDDVYCKTPCPTGTYGEHCDGKCGMCLEKTCDHVTGECSQCKPGFKEPLCQQLCPANTYGNGCDMSCGQCAGTTTCNVTTGVCPYGCKCGYQGDTCQEELSDPPTFAYGYAAGIGSTLVVGLVTSLVWNLYRRRTKQSGKQKRYDDLEINTGQQPAEPTYDTITTSQ